MPTKIKGIDELVEKLNEFGKGLTKKEAEEVGKVTVSQMKSLIANGRSPITGSSFPPYKNPNKYPGDRKPKSPVNLKLRGDFLKALKYKAVMTVLGWGVEIGYEGDEQLKEDGHRRGVHGQPRRPTIPQGSEQYTASVKKAYTEVILNALRKFVG